MKALLRSALLAAFLFAGTAAMADTRADSATFSRITIDLSSAEDFSPLVFGHNLEHTRAAVNGGLSAQMLKNRKFAGKPSRNQGLAAHWFAIGEKTFYFMDWSKRYTQHICLKAMKRDNELNSQVVQNMTDGLTAGMGQYGLTVEAGKVYEMRAVTMVTEPLTLKVELTDRDGKQIYAAKELSLTPDKEWAVNSFEMTPSASDNGASIRYTFTKQAEVRFGALSMMPKDNFHGMRSDVVADLKAIGPAIIRWPGGNFAGEYRWKDGLLDVDKRGPLGAATEIETQPYTEGYDYHEINTDDFIALCREVGAEPFLTINAVWSTPEESAQWVEYCNGSADTEYGRIRAERGFKEPFNVKYWSLGNEMGYSHMEGPAKPAGYAELAAKQVEAILKVDPQIILFSSGPYPSDSWATNAAAVLADKVPYVSLHHYGNWGGSWMHFTTEEGIRKGYTKIVTTAESFFKRAKRMRESLDKTGAKLHISYDEWNQWYSWYRPSCVAEGIFTAKYLHGIIHYSNPLDIPVCCYFQPVGEGAIIIEPTTSRLSANGQVFALMKAHKGGKLCPTAGAATEYEAIATLKDKTLTVTLINENYDQPKDFELAVKGKLASAKLLSSDDIRPYTYFNESSLDVTSGKKSFKTTLPPHSVALVEIVVK